MSPDILRESTVGELLNWVSGGRILPYPDQRPGFIVPERYLATSSRPSGSNNAIRDVDEPDDDDDVDAKPRDSKLKPSSSSMNVRASAATEVDEKPVGWSDAPTRKPSSEALGVGQPSSTAAALKREPEADTATAVDVEAGPGPVVLDKALENAQAELGDFILVDWYGDDDPENPRNWSSRKRHFVLFEICLLTYVRFNRLHLTSEWHLAVGRSVGRGVVS